MGRLFVFDGALCFRATHPYAYARNVPFLPRLYSFRLAADVAALRPCAVASAPHAAISLHLRRANASGAEASPCALLCEFGHAADEDDSRFMRNAVRHHATSAALMPRHHR